MRRSLVTVRRVLTPVPTLFGPAYWWEVALTPFEPVAYLSSWPIAVALANAYALSITSGNQWQGGVWDARDE